jgi:hypothetical protein
MRNCITTIVIACCVSLLVSAPLRAESDRERERAVAAKGLTWLAQQQNRDGHFEAPEGQCSAALTGMAGMAFLMEGSTLSEGKFADNIRRAADWLLDRTQRDGCIEGSLHRNRDRYYLYGHGYALLFLSQLHGEEDSPQRRKKLQAVLQGAVKYTCECQDSRGGWGERSTKEGGDFAETAPTVIQAQALRACREAGIAVPGEALEKALEYLKSATLPSGAVLYGLAPSRVERTNLGAAAVVSLFRARDYDSLLVRTWLESSLPTIVTNPYDSLATALFIPEFHHYYAAQVAYGLGDGGFEKLFPQARENERLTWPWSAYRKCFLDFAAKTQLRDGHWDGSPPIGSVYTACCYLTVLQLDNAALPIYQR